MVGCNSHAFFVILLSLTPASISLLFAIRAIIRCPAVSDRVIEDDDLRVFPVVLGFFPSWAESTLQILPHFAKKPSAIYVEGEGVPYMSTDPSFRT